MYPIDPSARALLTKALHEGAYKVVSFRAVPCRPLVPLNPTDLQGRTNGFTEFVRLPFVPMETPNFRKGRARNGPTLREAVLMHAVARLALNPDIRNIQMSWVKMGPRGAVQCLTAGTNDCGGTLMNESISKAAGAVHGQEMQSAILAKMIREIGHKQVQRTTLCGEVRAGTTRAGAPGEPIHAA